MTANLIYKGYDDSTTVFMRLWDTGRVNIRYFGFGHRPGATVKFSIDTEGQIHDICVSPDFVKDLMISAYVFKNRQFFCDLLIEHKKTTIEITDDVSEWDIL